MSFFAGMLGGVGSRARELRTESLRRQEIADERQRQFLQSIVESDRFNEDTGLREAALFGLMDLAQGVKPKRGFLENLIGGAPTQAGPAFSAIDRIAREFSQQPAVPVEEEPHLDVSTKVPFRHATPAVTPPPSLGAPSAQRTPIPTSASMAPPPGEPGSIGRGASIGPSGPPPAPAGAAPAVAAVAQADQAAPGGGGVAAAGGPPPMPTINTVPLVFDFPPRPNAKPAPTTTTKSRLWKSPADRIREDVLAREGAQHEAQRAHWTAIGLSPEEQKTLEMAAVTKRIAGTAGLREGEVYQKPDGTWVQPLYSPVDGKIVTEIPAMAPAARSVSGSPGMLDEIAARDYGNRTFQQLNPTEKADVIAKEAALAASRAAGVTTARAGAAATAPLSRGNRVDLTLRLQESWRKADLLPKTMREQLSVMETALPRFATDPLGASEAIRTAYITMFDPNATVREGDYVRLGLGRSFSDRIEGFIQSALQGGGNIPIEKLTEMVATAAAVSSRAQAWSADEAARIDAVAASENIDPAVIRGTAAPTPAAAPPPAATPAPRPAAGPQAQATPAGAPRVGDRVGNEYAGEVRKTRDGRFLGRLPDGTEVTLTQVGPNRFLY